MKNYVVGEGTHFRIPWFEYPMIYDIRARPRKIEAVTGSKGEPFRHARAIEGF